MEINEFLNQSEVKINSSAKQLDEMLNKYEVNHNFEKAFKNIHVTWMGDALTPKMFLGFFKTNEDKIKSINSDVTNLQEAIVFVIKEIITGKQIRQDELRARNILDSTTLPDYYRMKKPKDDLVEIFDVVDGKANEHDKDLYKCFWNAGEHVIFTSKEMTKLIIQNNDRKSCIWK